MVQPSLLAVQNFRMHVCKTTNTWNIHQTTASTMAVAPETLPDSPCQENSSQLQKGCLKTFVYMYMYTYIYIYIYIYIVRTCLNQLQLVQKIPEASRAHWGRESVCLNQGSDSFRRILSHQHALRTIHTFSIVFPCSCCVLSVRAHGQQLTIPHISSYIITSSHILVRALYHPRSS